MSAALVTAGGSAASARACHELADLYMSGNAVIGEHFRYCTPNDHESPLKAVVERRVSATSWQVVASGSGVAIYNCVGSTTRTYRLQGTSRQITVPCS